MDPSRSPESVFDALATRQLLIVSGKGGVGRTTVAALLGLALARRGRRVLVATVGQDDRLAWLLMPWLGLMLAQAALCAIVYGLTADANWDARYNPAMPARSTAWGPVLGAIAALVVGASALMATLAFSAQRFFEW